jgi:hypothetical protein
MRRQPRRKGSKARASTGKARRGGRHGASLRELTKRKKLKLAAVKQNKSNRG